MPTSRLADQRIRAAASQVVGLDVRGPVSRALGQIPVPLADEAGETAAPPTSAAPPTQSPRRTGAKPARRVVKPFADAPWPTQQARANPKAVLSGLTADERRVHRILLDTLAIHGDLAYNNGMGTPGLTYAEKRKLAVLDLAFIDSEIAKMEQGVEWNTPGIRWLLGIGSALMGLIAAGAAAGGDTDAALGFGAVAMVLPLLLILLLTIQMPKLNQASAPRRKIYDALRELALLVDDAPVSDALQQADAVIDRLAASDDSPRLRLDDSSTSASGGAPIRPRLRS